MAATAHAPLSETMPRAPGAPAPAAATASRVAPAAGVAPTRRFICSQSFDATLLTAPLLTGLAAAAVVAVDMRLFPLLLAADLWLLGYHHVVATYTRLAFDRHTLRANRFLAVDLLALVVVATVV